MENQCSPSSLIPSIATHSNSPTPSNQDRPQEQHSPHVQQQNQFRACHFHLLHLVENLAEVIESGNRDQHSDTLVNELRNHFENCQQQLNSVSGALVNAKAVTIEEQKHKLEESEQLLNQRREMISKYRNSVAECIKSDP